MALKLLEQTGDKPLVAAFVLEFIAQTLAAMAVFARREDPALPLLFAGGVMSNRLIATALSASLGGCHFAQPAFSADNAAGTALLCRAAALQA